LKDSAILERLNNEFIDSHSKPYSNITEINLQFSSHSFAIPSPRFPVNFSKQKQAKNARRRERRRRMKTYTADDRKRENLKNQSHFMRTKCFRNFEFLALNTSFGDL
jgi:hypothetical protein